MYLLVDANNFYASCEKVFDPRLAARPVAVLSNNDGCVVACSAELKALGFKIGTPYHENRDFFARHNVHACSSNYALYGDMSARVMRILGTFAAEVEPYSIDEAFLETDAAAPGACVALAKRIRATVLRSTGLPVSVGVAPTKTLAKIANRAGKKSPEGVFAMPENPREARAFLNAVEVGDIWGIGEGFAKRLRTLGVDTALKLAEMPQPLIREHFNACVSRTAWELLGNPCLEAEDAAQPAQSAGCSRSFNAPLTAPEPLREAVMHYAAIACEKVRRDRLRATGINFYFRHFEDYKSRHQTGGFIFGGATFPQPMSDTSAIMNAIAPIFDKVYRPGLKYRKAGVLLYGLVSRDTWQPDLFMPPVPPESDRLNDCIDALNRKLGRGAVFRLAEGTSRSWTMRRAHLSPRYTTNWDELPEVK